MVEKEETGSQDGMNVTDKLAKSDISTISTADMFPPEPTTSEAPVDSSWTTSRSHEGTAVEHEQTESAEALDESLRVYTCYRTTDHE